MKKLTFIISILMISQCYALIYELNGSDYSRMPPMFHLDDYDHCLMNPDGLYCTVDIDVVTDTPSELYTMMQNYSEYSKKHFNHTFIHHGVCVTRTCKRFLQNTTKPITYSNTDSENAELKLVIEECLNDSLWNNYELKCRVTAPLYCNEKEERQKDGGDLAVGVFLLVLLTLNVIGSLYDAIFVRRRNKPGNGVLLCFSVPHNFSRLMRPYADLGPREQRLKVFHGLRAMTTMGVIYCHSLLPFALVPENVSFVENIEAGYLVRRRIKIHTPFGSYTTSYRKVLSVMQLLSSVDGDTSLYNNMANYIFLNGTIVVQTFFIMSGCLLSYKLEMFAEKRDIKWTLLPKILIITWAKLTPSYMVVLATSATWLRYTSSGPFWKLAVLTEVEDCRADGWANMLYINNYVDHTQCMVQTWYLAANMQLYILGYCTFVIIKSPKYRKVALTILFIVGIITPMAHTYFQNLDAVLMVTPETARSFMDNPTFNHVYKRGHTNMANFVLGIALGFLIYRLQKNEVNMQKYKKYHYLFLLTVPAIMGTIIIGSVFYIDGIHTSVYIKAIYSGLVKPIYGVILAILIIGCVFEIENVYRPILEWDGWKLPAKLSYCAFLLHVAFIRTAAGSLRTLMPLTYLLMTENTVAFIVLSFLAAIPFWLLVDAPLTELLQKILTGKLCQTDTKVIPENNITLKNNVKVFNSEEGNASV